MMDCVVTAMREAGLGYTGKEGEGKDRVNISAVYEAEAGAMNALEMKKHKIKVCLLHRPAPEVTDQPLQRGQKILVIDGGGGTVDYGTYRVANEVPLRLAEQVGDPTGKSRI